MDLFPHLRMDGVDYGIVDLVSPWATRVEESGYHYLYLVRSGSLWFESLGGGSPFELRAGHVVGVTNNVPHSLRDARSTRIPDDLCRLPITPLRSPPPAEPPGPGRVRLSVGWVPYNVDPLVRLLPTVIHIPPDREESRRILHCADLAERELTRESEDTGSHSVVRRLSEIMVIDLIRFVSAQLRDGNPVWSRGLVDPDIARAIASLHADPGRPWTLRTLSRIAGLSRAAFEARFQRFAEESPKRYVVKVRMQRAAAELERGSRSVAEIAESLGYASVASFHRAFKRELGMTPADYRRGGGGRSPSVK